MFFTQEDYKKIHDWIRSNSIKDTEFNNADTPLKDTDTIALVLNNTNVRVSLKDFTDQLFLMGVSDFLNISHKYGEYYITLQQAIELIPYKGRKRGQVITFLDEHENWKIYLFRGEINQWSILHEWLDILDFEPYIINSILPDEEDLTKTKPDLIGNTYLSLKDREYNPEEFSGMGRIILRKNIVEIEDPVHCKVKKNVLYQDMFTQSNTVYECRYDFDLNGQDITLPDNSYIEYNGGSIYNGNIIDIAKGLNRIILRKNIKEGKNILTQDMINKENTIYEIRYDFDLNGVEITIPENCVLKFEGGNIKNGTVIGNNTKLNSDFVKIFDNIKFKGIWNIPETYPDWFGVVYNNSIIDNAPAIKNAVELSKYTLQKTIKFNNGELWINAVPDENITNDNFDVKKNTTIELYNNCSVILSNSTFIMVQPNSSIQYNVISGRNVENILIKGGHIIGDVKNHNGTTGEWGFAICFSGVKKSVIQDIECSYCWGDGIMLQGDESHGKPIEDIWSDDILIEHVFLSYNRRNNLSITCANNVKIVNCDITAAGVINGTPPLNGIDIEPWYDSEKCNGISIYNTRIYANGSYQVQLFGYNNENEINITNVNIDNCDISYNINKPFYQSVLPLWIRAKDVKITNSNISALQLQHADRLTVSNCTIGCISVYKTSNFTTLIKDNKISNCIIENNYEYFNQNSPIFNIQADVESLEVNNCICRSTTNGNFIDLNDDITTTNNIIFKNNIITTKRTTDFKDCVTINNVVTNPGYICQNNKFNQYNLEAIVSDYTSDYLVELIIPFNKNGLYTLYIEPCWTDYQHVEYSKVVFSVSYYRVYIIECSNNKSFIPINATFVSDINSIKITFAKVEPNSHIIFKGILETTNHINFKLNTTDNIGKNRTPIIPNIANNTVGSDRITNPYIGQCMYDITINKPIYWTGSKWVDATGADV